MKKSKKYIGFLIGLIPFSGVKIILYRLLGAKIGKRCKIGLFSYFLCNNYSQIIIDNFVTIGKSNSFHISELTIKSHTLTSNNINIRGYGKLTIGKQGYIAQHAFFDTSGNIEIGHYVATPPFGAIYSHNYSTTWFEEGRKANKNTVKIGDNCWFGPKTIISNSSIGNYCKAAPGSAIFENLPNHAMVMGNPAKIISKVYPKKLPKDFIKTKEFQDYCKQFSSNKKDLLFVSSKTLINEISKIKHTIIFSTLESPKIDMSNITLVDLHQNKIKGSALPLSIKLANALREWGLFLDICT